MKIRMYSTLVLNLFGLCLWAQPTADFTVDNTTICLGEAINFTNTSTGSGLTYLWDFFDGTISTEENPSHIYSTPGMYEVCLSVIDDQGGFDEFCQPGLITVLASAVNDISAILCFESSMTINGTNYNASNPVGTEVMLNGSSNGCDSIINVDLSFLPPAFGFETIYYCELDGCVFYSDGNCYSQGAYNVVFPGASWQGCDSTVTLNVLEVPDGEFAISNSTVTNASCDGLFDGSICVDDVICGQAPYTYEWSVGATTACINGLGAGSYTVTVSDNNALTLVEIYTLVAPPVMEVNVTAVDVTCYGANDGYIDFDVSGGISPYSFAPSNTENLAAGIYSFTITDAVGCELIVDNIIIAEPTEIQLFTAPTNPTCANADGAIDLTVAGGIPPYLYNWNDGIYFVQDPMGLVGGFYSVVVTDATGCTAETSITISGGPDLMVSIADVLCAGGNDGAVDLEVTNGQEPYTYIWSNGATTEDLSGLAVGEYVVTVTDADLCSSSQVVTITEPAPISILPTIDQPLCNGDSVCIELSPVGGAGGYTFLWPDGNTNSINCLSEGTFVVTVTDANGCTSASAPIVITQPLPLELTTTISCLTAGQNDGTITVEVIGGTAPYLYEWTNGFMTQEITGLSNGTYGITVTDANGCSISETVTLGFIESMSNDTLACAGSANVFVNAPTAISYSWEPASLLDNPNVASTFTNGSLTDSTLFTVTVTDVNGCVDVGQVWINVPDGPGFTLSAIHPECNTPNGGIELDILCPTTSPYLFDWSDLPGANDPEDRTDLAAGIYQVTVTDNNGLTTVESITLIDQGAIAVVINGTGNICEGETLELCSPSLPGSFTYLWTGPSGFTETTECISIPNTGIAQEGCYDLIITDINGCSGSAQICVSVTLDSDIITSIIPDILMCSGESTTLEVTPNNNLTNFTVAWAPSDNLDNAAILNPVASPLVTTTYTAVIIDSDTGCEATESVTVNVIEGCVWPGDTDTNKIVNNFDLLNIGLAYDTVGPIRPGANLMWVGQEAPDWTQFIPAGPNYKHADCDGNGIVNANDTIAITDNWGETHNFDGGSVEQFIEDYPVADGALLMVPMYVQVDTLIEGANMALPIILGEETNVAEDIYGIAFSVTYDTAFIVEDLSSAGFSNSWLGIKNNNMLTIQQNFPSEGRVDIAMTRIDGNEISDYGQLAQLFITVEDDILFAPEDDEEAFFSNGGGNSQSVVADAVFGITNVLVLNKSGESIPVIPTETTVPVGTSTDENNNTLASAINLYPNPATDRIWITTKNISMEKAELYDLNGQLLQATTTTFLNVQDVTPGLYLLKVQTEAGVYVEKILVE